jgi:putative cell wall-binding protein
MTIRRIKKICATAGITCALVVGTGIAAHADDSDHTLTRPGTPISERLAGADRYETAVAVSQAEYPDTAPVVYLASGVNFPDALAAGPAAALQQGPLLLTRPDRLPDTISQEIARLKPAKIVIVGGTGSISSKVETTLKSLSQAVKRVGGADRYETSRLLVEATFDQPIATVYLATGRDFPDALSAGAAATKESGAVILVNGTAQNLDTATTALLGKLKPTKIVVVGGTGAVSNGIAVRAKTLAASVVRVAGDNRYDTSAALAGVWDSASHAYVASGNAFPDALVGSALAGKHAEPLYVINPGCQTSATATSLKDHGTKDVTVIGGVSAVDPDAMITTCEFTP